MKNLLILLALSLPVAAFSQFRLETKNVIRPINLKLNRAQAEKITNKGSAADFVEYKNGGDLKTVGEEYFLTIANPNRIPIHFATGTANYMNVETAEANTVWQSRTVDLWQNIVIKTGNKQFVYSVKTDNCYAFVWHRGSKAWDLKKVKCDEYEGDKKKK